MLVQYPNTKLKVKSTERFLKLFHVNRETGGRRDLTGHSAGFSSERAQKLTPSLCNQPSVRSGMKPQFTDRGCDTVLRDQGYRTPHQEVMDAYGAMAEWWLAEEAQQTRRKKSAPAPNLTWSHPGLKSVRRESLPEASASTRASIVSSYCSTPS
jgi:hypothetical protein